MFAARHPDIKLSGAGANPAETGSLIKIN